MLTLLFCVGMVCILWYMSHLQSNLITSMALQDASLYSQALAEFRALYTSEVVETVKDRGIEVTHDYTTKEGAIPLPATLSMVLGKRIGEHASGAQIRLYSAYPFPWRQENGGLQDEFGNEAWNYLRQNPEKPFYRFEEFEGRRALRFATADLMGPGCVNCHNTHPASPKTDWKTGDTRGVLEVILPLDTAVSHTRVGLGGTFALMATLSVLGVSSLSLVIGRLRRSSAELQQRASALESEITERQRVEEALQQSEEKYRHIINAAADAIISLDERGLVCEFNRAAEQMFGFTKSELVGKPLTPIMPERLRSRHTLGLQRYLCTGQRHLPRWQNIELPGVTKDSREFPLEVAFSLFDAAEKKILTGVLRDITERKRAEDEIRTARDTAEAALRDLKAAQASLIHAEKMASLGQLTAGIAHEIKNPLNFVNNFADLSVELLDELKQTTAPAVAALDEETCTEVDEIVRMLTGNLAKIAEHGRRADGIVKSMLAHSRGSSSDRQNVDINALVEEALNLAYHGARAQDQNFNITLERELDADAAPIELVPQDVTRVFLNLFGNGFYATDKRRRDTGEPSFRPKLKVTTRDLGEAVEIRVRDNGIGIAPEFRDKMFQPFVTTKPTGEGTGLGLSISYEIITQQHGGVIEVDSRVGEFTEFTVRLPRYQRPVMTEAAS